MDSGNDSDGANTLNDLLSDSDTEENESNKGKTIKELDYNFLDGPSDNICNDKVIKNDFNTDNQKSNNNQNIDEHINYNIDSSDDEDKRNFEEQTYSEYGRDIKHLLKKDEEKKKEHCMVSTYEKDSRSLSVKNTALKNNGENVLSHKNIYNDPYFGISIVNPLISSSHMKERMVGKTAITVSGIKTSIASGALPDDWVIAGVLINKSSPKTSQKGSTYCIWKISDLSDNIATVSIFLFSAAYKTFWKTTLGTVIGILNPNILESKDDIDQATLSIDAPQKIMIIGKSKDMGKCKSVKKNGDPCTAIVNTNRCEYCIYHVKQEYKKCSRRSDLGSSGNTHGFSSDKAKNKLKSNSKIFNSNGMQPFVPIHAKESATLRAHDQKRLAFLSNANCNKSITATKNKDVRKGVLSAELESNQSVKDRERINKLKVWNSNKPLKTEVVTSSSSSEAMADKTPTTTGIKEKKMISTGLSLLSRPRLGVGCNNGEIDFSQPITKNHREIAKKNAISWIQQNGTIKAKNPNRVGLGKDEKRGLKRVREINENVEENPETKKKNSLPDNFKELMETKSQHVDLIEKSYKQEEEKYFNKLEIKEKMEEKMLSTFKVQCKAVKCLICKYTAFSSSDLCKEQKHPIRVIDAIKRFFKCSNCGNRTVSLERLPLHSCTKCSSSSWARAAMMDERKTVITGTSLSVRGDEEKFIGSASTAANLNLLVPEID